MIWLILVTSSLESFKEVSRCASLSEYFDKSPQRKCVYGKLLKRVSVGDCQTYLWFLSQTFVFLESVFLPLHTCVKNPHFGKMCFFREIKSISVVKVFSVSCESFKEMFSGHYGKWILPTYLEWNIRQVWKFNILWASSKTKFSNLLNARHRENCHGYLLRTFLSASLQKWSIMFLIYLNGYKHVTQPLYFWRKVAFICLSFFSEFLCGKVQQGLRVVCYEFECMCYELRVTRLKARVRRLKTRVEATKAWINPNKAGIFESSFSWGGGGINLTPLSPPNLHITRRTCLISI